MKSNGLLVTIPAAASAMGVSRIVLERAIEEKALTVHAFMTGSKGPGFRLVPVDSFKTWLQGRKGYYEVLNNGATKFRNWGDRKNPDTIVKKALEITNGAK